VRTLFLLVALGGCATTKDWAVAGGSRADGVVELSHQSWMLQTAHEDEAHGAGLANFTCSEWGYAGARPSGGETEICNKETPLGQCIGWLVTRKYKCLGSPVQESTTQ